jgi:hypothetical protein
LTTSLLSSTFHVTVSSSSCTCTSGYINSNDDWSDGCESTAPKCDTGLIDCNNDGSNCCICEAGCSGEICDLLACGVHPTTCPKTKYTCLTKLGDTFCCACKAQCDPMKGCDSSILCY